MPSSFFQLTANDFDGRNFDRLGSVIQIDSSLSSNWGVFIPIFTTGDVSKPATGLKEIAIQFLTMENSTFVNPTLFGPQIIAAGTVPAFYNDWFNGSIVLTSGSPSIAAGTGSSVYPPGKVFGFILNNPQPGPFGKFDLAAYGWFA